MSSPQTVWCNVRFGAAAARLLEEGLAGHRLVFSTQLAVSNLVSGGADPLLAEADVAFGQPEPGGVVASARVRWVQLNSAGYTRYDSEEFRRGFAERGAQLTNSSAVYADPCAEQALAFLLAVARELPQSVQVQWEDRSWPAALRRSRSRLLRGQKVVLLGFGAIGRRLAELLAPFEVEITAFRRLQSGSGGVRTVDAEGLEAALGEADHVVNLLPDNAETRGFMSAARFAAMKRGACFCNVGRGTTVDQEALIGALESGHLSAAYLDVTDPEPLPSEHPLWKAPGCWITPHTAGGHHDEEERLVRHFLANFRRYLGGEPLADRVI